MSVYVGHESVVRRVRAAASHVNIFLGPESVGKWTLAEHLRKEWDVLDTDILRVHRLTADNSRMIERFALSAAAGSRRVIIARLKDASRVSYNILLKTLEDAPETSYFFLIAEDYPPATIASRGHVFRFGPLPAVEVEEVLTRVRRFNPDKAEDIAPLARGQIKTALSISEIKERKMMILRVLEAFRQKDVSILEGLAPRWTDEDTQLLICWCQEAITKRWRFFSEEESGFQGNRIPLKILMALKAEVRPRLTVRASLISALLGEK